MLPPLFFANLFEKALFPWLIGIVLGGSLGGICALGTRGVLSRFPRLRRPAMLLPWRAVLLVPLLQAWLPDLLFVWFPDLRRLVNPFLSLQVAAILPMVLLTMLFVTNTLLDHGSPSPLATHLIAGGRTLAVASVIVAALTASYAGSTLGFSMFHHMQLLHWSQVRDLWWAFFTLILVVDVLLGIVHALVSCVAEKASETRPI